ncbi:MAG: nucleoside hydrolase [Geminicoccaceae bacterium]|nr:nucleoside hydrolase [Geminicoccaceae bacterium]
MGIWVDTDMGVDDLFAIFLVRRYLAIDGISLVFGNAPLDRVCRNAAGARDRFGWTMPIVAGADRALLGGAETAQRILGESGMPSRGERLPECRAIFEAAQPALAAWLERAVDARILALGPLANLAILVLHRPDLAGRIGEVVWMGGGVTRGNHTASAEFNALADPEALAVLLAREVPLTMIDLDACRQVEITEDDVRSLAAPPLIRDLLGGYLDIALTRGRTGMALYDPVAAAALACPELFTFAAARIDVELAGRHTRGRTVVDQRDPVAANARIVDSLDAATVKSLCLSALEDVC